MRELLDYIIENILKSRDFEIEEVVEGNSITFKMKLPEDKAGLVIGKGGRTIKAIRNLLKVRATLEKKLVFLAIE